MRPCLPFLIQVYMLNLCARPHLLTQRQISDTSIFGWWSYHPIAADADVRSVVKYLYENKASSNCTFKYKNNLGLVAKFLYCYACNKSPCIFREPRLNHICDGVLDHVCMRDIPNQERCDLMTRAGRVAGGTRDRVTACNITTTPHTPIDPHDSNGTHIYQQRPRSGRPAQR